MIDGAELRNWLMSEIEELQTDAPEPDVALGAKAMVSAYLRVGQWFEVLSDDDQKAVYRLLA